VKDIPYKTKCETIHPPFGRINRLTFGNMKHATFEARFALCINAPGARRGDKVVILEKRVASVDIPNFVRCRECEPEFLRLDRCLRRPIKSVTEKDCIFVKVKVVKPMMTHFSGKELSEEFLEEY
jgi:hypothetical protein